MPMNQQELRLFTLTAGNVRADITNLGARIVRLFIDDTDVVQGFDSPEDYLYEHHQSDFGAVIGRYANRLAQGRFAIDGDIVQLPQNNGPNCLHGGPRGWQYSLFEVAGSSDTRLELTLTSPDGDNGFPGTVQVRVVYTLSDDGSLRIDYHAATDKPTVINMTNHSYFNLSGQPGTTIDDHVLWIDAYRYTPIDQYSIPLGKHRSVAGTPFDFRLPKAIGRDIASDDEQLLIGRGYDHNFVLNHRFGPGVPTMVATLFCPRTDIMLQLFTDAPGLQLYTGNYLDGVVGKRGVAYPRRSAVCLEAQQYPDSPNRRWPESTGRLLPGSPYHSTTIFNLTRND